MRTSFSVEVRSVQWDASGSSQVPWPPSLQNRHRCRQSFRPRLRKARSRARHSDHRQRDAGRPSLPLLETLGAGCQSTCEPQPPELSCRCVGHPNPEVETAFKTPPEGVGEKAFPKGIDLTAPRGSNKTQAVLTNDYCSPLHQGSGHQVPKRHSLHEGLT